MFQFQVTVDGAAYATHPTREAAEAAAYTFRRWSSLSTKVEVIPVAAVRCAACDATGVATRLVWIGAAGDWASAPGPCRSCNGTGSVPAPAVAA